MANETNTYKKDNGKDNGGNLAPIIIIGGIFLATVLGIYWISSSGEPEVENDRITRNLEGKGTSTDGGTTSQTQNQAIPNYDTAPAGATPMNFKGSENSPVVIEEFADFQCPTCAVVHPKMKEIAAKYGDRIKFIFRQYPLTQMHPKAYDAALATEAAGVQGKFWEMQNMIFENQSTWVNSPDHKKVFGEYAQKIGLDVAKFKDDMIALPTKNRVEADMKRGTALNIRSTPSIVLNKKLVPFSQVEVAALSSLIDAELKNAPPQDSPQIKSDEESSDKKAENTDKKEDTFNQKEEKPKK